MNMKMKLQDIEVPLSEEIQIKLGNIEIEYTELDLKEYLQVLKEMPSIIKEMREAIEEPLEQETQEEDYSHQAFVSLFGIGNNPLKNQEEENKQARRIFEEDERREMIRMHKETLRSILEEQVGMDKSISLQSYADQYAHQVHELGDPVLQELFKQAQEHLRQY